MAIPNITDGPSTGYGDEAAIQRSTDAVPMAPFVGQDEVPNASDPSARPEEPLTAGLPMGPGPGPEVLGFGPQGQTSPVRKALQAMLLAHPNNDIMRLIDRLDIQGR